MTATLRLAREGFAIELRRGTFHVLLDGKDVGSIEWHQTIQMPLQPGHHTLQIRAGRYTSRKRSFRAVTEEIVNFRCTGANLWPLYFASIARPGMGISLKRE